MSGWGDLVFKPTTSGGGGGNTVPVGSTQVPGDTATVGPSYSIYDESFVISGATSAVLTWLVPLTPIHHILRIEFGGCNIARYYLEINGVTQAQHITYFSGDFSGYWDFRNPGGGGLLVPAAATINVNVNNFRPTSTDFYARIQYIEIN